MKEDKLAIQMAEISKDVAYMKIGLDKMAKQIDDMVKGMSKIAELEGEIYKNKILIDNLSNKVSTHDKFIYTIIMTIVIAIVTELLKLI